MGALEVKDVWFAYDDQHYVLSGLSMYLAKSQSCLVVGNNGSGKSTLGRLLCGLLRPTRGTIALSGSDPSRLATRRRSTLVSYMGQVSYLSILTATIRAELKTFCRNADWTVSDASYRDWARRMCLPVDTDANPRDLTMPDLWRLVLILHGVILQPRLLVIDEVFCAGNDLQQKCLREVIEHRQQRSCATMVLYQRRLPVRVDKAFVLSKGRMT